MPSTYDDKKKCRVGTMDQDQFYRECEPENAAYFRGLIAAWTKAGGTLRWGAGGVGMRGTIGDSEAGVCFLAPQFAGKKDRIELACASLVKQIGDRRVKILENAIREAARQHALGKTMISVVRPGALSPIQQRALTKALADML